MWVGMEVETNKKFSRNCTLTLTPVLNNNTHTETLPSIVITTRRQKIIKQRNKQYNPKNNTVVCKPRETVGYYTGTEYKDWMDGCALTLNRTAQCCTNTLQLQSTVLEYDLQMAQQKITPVYALAIPFKDQKSREHTEKGCMMLEFAVGNKKLNKNFRNNNTEIHKITEILDRIPQKNITSIEIWGTCSPEGSYSYNTKLAKGRASVVQQYIETKYNYKNSLFNITTTPENWEGLKLEILRSNIQNKTKILEIINSTTSTPDQKDAQLRALSNYKELLMEYYPMLRQTKFTVHYTVTPQDQNKIKELYETNPQELTEYELYSLALQDSTMAYQIMIKSAELYPQSATANINAAVVELKEQNTQAGEKYLQKTAEILDIAGNAKPKMVWAVYYNTAAILQLEKGDIEGAKRLLQHAQRIGLTQASQNLELLEQ